MPKPKDDDVLTDALSEFLIQGKRLVFAPSGSVEEREAARQVIRTADRIRKVFDEDARDARDGARRDRLLAERGRGAALVRDRAAQGRRTARRRRQDGAPWEWRKIEDLLLTKVRSFEDQARAAPPPRKRMAMQDIANEWRRLYERIAD